MSTPDRGSLAEGLVAIGEEAVAKSNDRLFLRLLHRGLSTAQPRRPVQSRRDQSVLRCATGSFTDFTIRRAQVLVDGNFVSARTVMAGRFDREFAYTPIGTVQPNGQHVTTSYGN
jgi:hypothetical protein